MNLTQLLAKRIPTILGLFFLGAGLVAGIFIVGNGTGGFFPKASPDSTPKHVKMTNVNDSAFTVSFVTDTATPGYMKYGTSATQLDSRVGDDRDQLSGSVGEFTTHHITARNLNPGTTYYFEIGTATNYMYRDNNSPYSVTTAPKIGGSPEAFTAYGTVVTKASTPAKDSIIYVTVNGSTPISTLAKSSGGWAMTLSTARTENLQSYVSITDSTSVNIFVQGKDDAQTSSLSLTAKESQPVATIILGENNGALPTVNKRDNALESTLASPLPTPTPVSSPIPSPSPASQTPEVIFYNPAKEGESINSVKPEIRGKAPINTEIEIMVESDPVYTDTLETDAQGNWKFTPPGNLTPGEHTITISYTDDNGVKQTVKRTFTVLAQGTSNLPALIATPSASPKVTPKPSTSPKPTASPKASGSATIRSSYPATGSGIPKSGNIEQTYTLLFSGILCMIVGFILWHKSTSSPEYVPITKRSLDEELQKRVL